MVRALINPFMNARSTQRDCKICCGKAVLFDVVDFNKFCTSGHDCYKFGLAGIPVYFLRCLDCQFVFTDYFDDWDKDAFSKHVYNDEYIRVDGEYADVRPARMAESLARRFDMQRDLAILDYGSGSGEMAKRLAALGFTNIECFDVFSQPNRPQRKFDIVTAIEVVEHSIDPIATFKEMQSFLSPDGAIIFTTGILPADIETIKANWWYISPRNGHASIFSSAALCRVAEGLGLAYYPGPGLHAFKPQQISPAVAYATRDMTQQMVFLTLRSPHMPADSDATWNAAEESGYRWSRQPVITWPVALEAPAARLHIDIPFAMEVTQGFAANCQVRVAGQVSDVKVENRAGHRVISSVVSTNEAINKIELLTPPTLRPSDLRASTDQRDLGLAVFWR